MACFCFQNPNDGYPMMLVERHGDGEPVVEVCDDLGPEWGPKDSTRKDAENMTRAVRGLELREAAKLLKREFGAADIFD